MRVHLVFHRIGDDLAARQGVQHAGVPHGDAVVDGHRVELTRDAAGLLHGLGDETPNFVEMYVPGDEFVEGVGNGDDRLAEILAVNAGRTVERAGTGEHSSVHDFCRSHFHKASIQLELRGEWASFPHVWNFRP